MKKRKSDDLLINGREPHKKSRHGGGQHDSETTLHTRISQNGSSASLPTLPQINATLWKTVFTHKSSLSHKDSVSQSTSYERLEWLGDAYIELMATRLIWKKFTDLPVGRLSQIRELLVKNQTLGEIASQYGLDKQIETTAVMKSNPKIWAKVRGDMIEAYVAAVVLADEEMGGDGFKAAEKWLHQLWMPKLEGILAEKTRNSNAKDALSRQVVSQGVKLEYLSEKPMEHLEGGQQTHSVGAFLTGWGYTMQLLGSGRALSKAGAGNLAAEDALRNPLTGRIAEMKMEHDKRMQNHGATAIATATGPGDSTAMRKLNAEERVTREKELVEKKRNMFMSTEFG